MSEFHCWYVIGRNLRLAIAYALFASLIVVNPAFAVEDTDLTAQKTTISNGSVTAMDIAETASPSVDAEQDSFANSVATDAAALDDLTPAAGYATDEGFVLPDDGETYELVLELVRKSDTLSNVLVGLERSFEYYLPVDELARILKFPSEVDLGAQRIQGVFFNSSNPYSIDVGAGTYTVAGETFPLPEGSAIVRGPDEEFSGLYIKADVLNQVWPLELGVDISSQVVSIDTNRKLPYEQERQRKLQQEKLERERAEQNGFSEKYDYVPNGYRWLGPQTLRFNDTLDWDGDRKELRNDMFIAGTGDALGASASYSVRASQSAEDKLDVSDIRLRFVRKDYGSGELLPFGLKVAEFGDVDLRSSPLIGNASDGRGIYVSSGTRDRFQAFDEVAIEGIATPGWEVEVYRGNALIDFGFVDDSGEYRFENVPLNFGSNDIRVVLYGPQGQIEERTEEYFIKRSFLRPGETTYELGVVEDSRRLIELDEDRKPTERQIGRTARINRGINQYMSGYATFTDIPGRDDNEQYLSAGLDFNAWNGAGQVEAYKQVDGGTALDLNFARQFYGVSTVFRTSLFRDFESKRAGFGDVAKKHETSLRLSKNFPLSFGGLQINLSGLHTKYVNETYSTSFSAGQTLSHGRFNTTNTINSNYNNGDHKQTLGQISTTTSLSERIGLGSRLSYEIAPDAKFDSADISLNYSDLDKLTAYLSVGQGIEDTSSTTASVGASYDFGKFFGNAAMDWTRGEGIDVKLSTSTTLGPSGENLAYELTNKYRGQPTSLRVQLYHDLDEDGEYSDEDDPLEGARVFLNGGRRSSLSDSDGVIEMYGAGPEGLTTITLERKSLSNPFLVSANKEGYRTVLRNGTKPFINFPLIMTGSIDGTVYKADGEPAVGLIMQLIDQHGELVAEAPTLSDGFYVFELVRPGRYIVQVHPSHPVFVPTQTVTVASDDLFAYGVDLQVLEQATEASVVNEGEGRVAHTYQALTTGGTEMPVSTTTSSGVQPVIRAVRIGEYSDKTRLVLDLSGPISYQVTREKTGNAIFIDLPNAITDVTSADWKAGKHTLFSTIEIHELPNGGTQIKLNANAQVDVRESKLLDPAPEAGKGHRFYIDFTKTR